MRPARRSATARRRSRSASPTAPRCAPHAEAFARAPLAGRAASAPWEPLLETARERGRVARETVEAALAEELAYLPKKEHKRRETGVRPSGPSAPSGAPRPARWTRRCS